MATKQSSEVTVTTDGPPSPSGISATVQSNDKIDVSWTDNGLDSGQYKVQTLRDGGSWVNPSGGATTVGSNTTSASYGPNSDNSYASQVGIDSSFKFRVRAEADGATSGWKYSSTVTTDPIPPRNARASRPDANTITVEWTNASDILTKTAVFYRKDTGGGYGSWNYGGKVNNSTTGKGQTASLTYDTSGSSWLEPNARYQFRIRHESTLGTNGRQDSEFVYHDYGNENNVYHADDFSSGDKSAWDSSNGGNVVSSGGHADTGVSGPVTGGNYFQGYGDSATNSTYLQKNLGDLSGEGGVHIRVRMAVGSMDSSAEDFGIDWYDGSSWRQLKYLHWEYNEQGWVEVHVDVPDSWMSTDARVRVGTTTDDGMYAGDFFAVDEVVVSDLLHEYTSPAAPDNLNLSTTNNGISANWNDVAPFVESGYVDSKYEINYEDGDSNVTKRHNVGTSYTETSLRDGEEYTVHVHTAIRQPRNGQGNTQFFLSTGSNSTIVSPFQKPTNISLTYVDDDQLDVSWDDTSNYGDYRIRMERDGTWTDPNNADPGRIVNTGTSSASLYASSDSNYAGNVGIDSQFDVVVRHQTEHGSSEYGGGNATVTTPVPPQDVSVNRPDANTFEIDWNPTSDVAVGEKISIEYREDTGGGYGSWTHHNNYGAYNNPYTVSTSDEDFQKDVRYQFRVRFTAYGKKSEWVYADYGNEGNVYFQDDFESGDLSKWGGLYTDTDADSGIQSGSVTDLGISGADEGTYYCRLDSGDDIRYQLGSISTSSDVLVKATVATGSMDFSSEETYIEWYDGSNYQQLRTFGWEYNRQGWINVSAVVPSSYLNSNNHIRFRGYGGGGDHFAVDNVVVSDVLHEYTKPASPNNLRTDTATQGEITATVNGNVSVAYKASTSSSKFILTRDGSLINKKFLSPIGDVSVTFSGLLDGEHHDVSAVSQMAQARNGSKSTYFISDTTLTATPTTLLPEPSNLSVSATGGTANLSWTKGDNNSTGDYEVFRSTDGGSSYTKIATLGSSATSYTDSGISNEQRYDYRLERVVDTRSETSYTIVVGTASIEAQSTSSWRAAGGSNESPVAEANSEFETTEVGLSSESGLSTLSLTPASTEEVLSFEAPNTLGNASLQLLGTVNTEDYLFRVTASDSVNLTSGASSVETSTSTLAASMSSEHTVGATDTGSVSATAVFFESDTGDGQTALLIEQPQTVAEHDETATGLGKIASDINLYAQMLEIVAGVQAETARMETPVESLMSGRGGADVSENVSDIVVSNIVDVDYDVPITRVFDVALSNAVSPQDEAVPINEQPDVVGKTAGELDGLAETTGAVAPVKGSSGMDASGVVNVNQTLSVTPRLNVVKSILSAIVESVSSDEVVAANGTEQMSVDDSGSILATATVNQSTTPAVDTLSATLGAISMTAGLEYTAEEQADTSESTSPIRRTLTPTASDSVVVLVAPDVVETAVSNSRGHSVSAVGETDTKVANHQLAAENVVSEEEVVSVTGTRVLITSSVRQFIRLSTGQEIVEVDHSESPDYGDPSEYLKYGDQNERVDYDEDEEVRY